MTDIYFFDLITGEYVGQGVATQDQFFTDVIPANATIEIVPSAGANQIAIYDVVAGSWSLVDDYRGEVWYYKNNGTQVQFEIGDALDLVTMTNIPKPVTDPELYIWDTINDPVLHSTSTGNVALTGTAPLVAGGLDLTGETAAVVLLNNQTNLEENGYYNYVEAAGDYTLTPTAVWIYDLDFLKLKRKAEITTVAVSNLTEALIAGGNSIYDVVAYAFAKIDQYSYAEKAPVPTYVFTTDVALTDTAPLIQDGNDLTGVTATVVRLEGQTNEVDNGYYDYVESGGNYTLTFKNIAETHFYNGIKDETGDSILKAHDEWGSGSNGAAYYLAIFSSRKKTALEAIDAATTAEDVLLVNWTAF